MTTKPMTPSVCDLRGYEFMPLYGHHLFGSDFNARVSDSGWRAAVTLWWAAWNQVPAASLPNDDIALTRLADLGRDLKAFRKIKVEALSGFVECDDGRLYHKALAVWALEAWERRVKERERKAVYRAGQSRDKQGTKDGTSEGQSAGQVRDTARDVHVEGKRSEVKGSDIKTLGGGLPTVPNPEPVDKFTATAPPTPKAVLQNLRIKSTPEPPVQRSREEQLADVARYKAEHGERHG